MPPDNGKGSSAAVVVRSNSTNNNAQMFQIFQNVQHNVVQHKKYVKELKKLYKKLNQDAFRESFSNALHYLFTFGDTSANVDRVVQFVATFCTSLDDEEEFLLFIFGIIFDCQCVAGQSVRYRASQLLAAVLSALGDDASLDDDLCDKLLISQTERLQDTRGAVRCRAALALQRLQNPIDQDDQVTRSYRFHMSCDPSSSVRRAIVMSIAKCTRNLPYVLERLCDVDEAVRRAAFLYVSSINVTQLKVRQRVHTLKVGLTERSPRVKRVVEEILLPGWLSTFKGNIVELLTAVRLDNIQGAKDSQYVAGKLLESLFKRLPTSELLEWLPTDKTLRVIPAEKLGKETAWYWRHLAEHLIKQDDDETLENVLPDLVVLTAYIRAIVESPCPSEKEDPVGFGTRQYVLHELACLLRVYDTSDQVGRASLQQLLFDVLTGDHGPINEEVIAAFVCAIELVLPEVTSRVEFIGSIITELREPSEPEPAVAPEPVVDCTEAKLQRARLRVSLNVAMEAQEEAVRDQNYALAAECKAKVERLQQQLEEFHIQPAPVAPPLPVVREKSDDPVVLNKCLQILNMAMDTPQISSITPLLKLIFTELEVEIFQNPEILDSALKTVSLYGMLDAEFAKEHKAFFFANLMDLDNERVSCTVLRCVVDLLCVHGAKLFEDDITSQPSDDSNSNKRKKNRTLQDASNATNIMDHTGDQSNVTILATSTHGTVIELLLKVMEGQCDSYRLIVVEGLCRLLMLSHLESPSILSRLLLLWFNPATESEDLLRQTIGVFFQSFAMSVDGAQDQIQKATLPTLKALANAPAHSPLAEIDQESIVRFIVSLTRVQNEMSDSQGNMAVLLASTLVEEVGGPVTGLLCRCLSLLHPPRDPALCTDLARTLRQILIDLPDKTSSRNITRYLGALEASERATMHKMSTMGTINELTGVTEDNVTACIGRATSSLPAHPIARSTHIVINETVEEEVEIDETSPPDATNNPNTDTHNTNCEKRDSDTNRRNSDTNRCDSDTNRRHSDTNRRKLDTNRRNSDTNRRDLDTNRRNLDTNRRNSDTNGRDSDTNRRNLDTNRRKSDTNRRNSDTDKKKDKQYSHVRQDSDSSIRVNTVRGSRIPDYDSPQPRTSLDSEIEREADISGVQELRKSTEGTSDSSNSPSPQKKPRIAANKGTSAVTPVAKVRATKNKKLPLETPSSAVRRSGRSLKSTSSSESTSSGKSATSGKSTSSGKSATSGKTKNTKKSGKTAAVSPKRARSSVASNRSSEGRSEEEIADLADETELHTIVYEKEFEQSLMADSSDEENQDTKESGHVTVPETPESTEESESEPDISTPKAKGKSNKGVKK